MVCFKASTYNNAIFFLVSLLFFSIPATLLSSVNRTGIKGPVVDSILQQQRDSMLYRLNLEYLNGVNDNRTPYELITIIEEILNIDPALYNQWFNLGIENIKIHEYYRAIDALNQGLDLYPSKQNPSLVQIYISLSFCYHQIHKHQNEREILDFISQINPDHPGIIGRYIICYHSRLRYSDAEYYQKQLISILQTRHVNESDVAFYLGRLYLNTDFLEAEKHFRIAFQYDPNNVEKLGALAWALIRNALKIDEGMALIEHAIEADPNNAIFIHQQGYGFYIKGNYEDALFNLYNARELYEQYSYELNNHIQMVVEAIADLEK